MPNFSDVFVGNDLERKLTKDEMIRSLRFSISAEIEAIMFYDQLSNAGTNPLFKKVMTDVAKEEKVHLGEFLRVLFELDPNEEKVYEEGFREVEKFIRNPGKI